MILTTVPYVTFLILRIQFSQKVFLAPPCGQTHVMLTVSFWRTNHRGSMEWENLGQQKRLEQLAVSDTTDDYDDMLH